MPNARDVPHDDSPPKILTLGDTGSGKTTQLLTLPGKKFCYLFDPNAINTLRGHDLDYEEFLPDRMSLDVRSLTSADKDKAVKAREVKVMGQQASKKYQEWEKDFDDRLAKGFFGQYDWIIFDSFTTFSDMVMDEVLRINGRAGGWPQQDDYGPQMIAIQNVVRTVTGMKKGLYFTGHYDLKQDELSKRIFNVPLLTGRLRVKVPLLFSEIFAMVPGADPKGNTIYQIQTRTSREYPTVRCSIKGLEKFEDVTIDWSKPFEGKQGLGCILVEKGGYRVK